ncbi:MAG: NAD(P)/FAD-dependent oxidoreductase [Bacteroidetes bacterium]|nr:MAG: NAD(P)/FAD-dependent oxidoreductase [Bacteroidota bacterium]
MIETDICIIGAGPVGLFAVFEAGLLNLRCHLIDALPQTGGQLSEVYPQKPIYDIPGYPSIRAADLITELEKQIAPFHPTFTLGERVETLEKRGEADFLITTSEGTTVAAKAVVIAGGLGCFEPRKPELPDIEAYERHGLDYMVRDPEKYRGKRVVIAGGGDSALDWAVYLADIAGELSLIHRREDFRGAPDTGNKVLALAEQGKIRLFLSSTLSGVGGEGSLQYVDISGLEGSPTRLETDALVVLFGLSPKLGPIETWGLNIDKRAIEVDTRDYSTNIPGVYAIGDINTYPGKLKLILCGFHEAALMAHSAYAYMNGGKKVTLKYTTVTGISGF